MSVQVPKGYKQTEVGVIPEDWELSTIGENTKWLSGGTPSRSKEEYWKGDIPWISGSTLKSVEISNSDQFLTMEAVFAGSKMAPLNSTLLLVRGSALHNEIRAGQVVKDVAFNQDVKALVPSTSLYPKFLTFFILGNSENLLKLVSSAGNSAGVLDTKLVQNFLFLKPPLEEQKIIAEVLSDADALIESLEQLIAKKRQIKQGAMQELLTGQRRLPGFSGEWIEKSFGELFEFSGGFSASREDLSLEGYCYLHYGDIHGSKKQYIDTLKDFSQIPKLQIDLKKISSKSLLKNGDVVFVDASEDDSGVSKHIVVRNEKDIPFISGLHTIVAKQKTNLLTREYLEYCFSNEIIHNQFIHYSVGTKVTGISKKNIAKIFVKFPPQDEQLAISKILSDIDEDISELLMRLDKARQIKQAMMQELLTGRIRLV